MTRRLYRSRTDSVLGGVAAGLANYLNTDPALVRIGWAILVPITNGAAFLAYIVAWIVIPEAPVGVSGEAAADEAPGAGDAAMPAVGNPPASTAERHDGGRAGLVVGIGLVLLGVWFLLRDYLPDFDWNWLWPAILIGVGALILIGSARRRD
ncbi:MAG TPA: PspC domain-containing protein [Candidatus Limnocylindria bacterium]